jgi:hypothetical protein
VVRDGTAAELATERSSAIPLEVLRDSSDTKAFMTTLLYQKSPPQNFIGVFGVTSQIDHIARFSSLVSSAFN